MNFFCSSYMMYKEMKCSYGLFLQRCYFNLNCQFAVIFYGIENFVLFLLSLFVKLDRDIVFLVVCKLRIYAYKCNFYHHLCGGCSIWLCFQMSIYLC